MFKFKWISNTPIFRRLFIAFAMAAVIPGIIISILGTTYINQLNSRGQSVQTSNASIRNSTVQQATLQHMHADLIALQATTYFTQTNSNVPAINAEAQQLFNEISSLQAQFEGGLRDYQLNYEIATSPNMADVRSILAADGRNDQINEQQDLLNQVVNEWSDYQNAQQAVLTDLQKHNPRPITDSALNEANNLYIPMQNNWDKLVNNATSVGDIIGQVGPSQTDPIILATVVAILSTILVVVSIGYVVNLTITRPLRQLATLTRRIARGETNARAELTGRDEIYMVAESMNKMLDNIVRLIQETQAQRDTLQAQVEKLVSEVSGVGEGDLSVQAEVTADALGVLADSFNYMVEELGSLVVRVKAVAHEVEKSTSTILDRMTQLVETGDIQIRQINEAAVEVEHMADSSRQVADRAQVLYNVARDARFNAQDGRNAVQQAIEGMGRINLNVQETSTKVQTLGERSREINNIVEVIAGIAHQTNRLALDAAIQAAMAGENGKGFGAVAADIRRLAERAKDQASSIARIVRSVREDIGAAAVSMQDTERETSAGARLTQEAGIALESIFSAVEHQAREIENINKMAMQQLQSSSAVVQIMHDISASTQQSSASTRDASQNMERLARLVEQLRASVEAFKLRENQGYYIPNGNVTITPEHDGDNDMTVSGIFRTVTASSQPVSAYPAVPALPAGKSTGPFAYPSLDNFPPQENSGPPSQFSSNTWNVPFEPFNEQAGNGSRNR